MLYCSKRNKLGPLAVRTGRKLSLLNLSKRDDLISATFFENIVTTKFESQLVVVF